MAENRSLAGIRCFTEVPGDALADLEKACRWRSYDGGQLILSHHDLSNDVYFIVAGTVRVVLYSPAGKEVSFGELGAGSMFGEIAAIDGRPRSASIIAETNALIADMPAATFTKMLAAHPDVAARVLRQFADLVRQLSTRIFEFSVLAVKNRIHAELLRLARRNGIEDNRAVLSPAPTHSDIASRVSTHREAVTRELNVLAREGLMERSGGAVVITDVARLAKMVEEVTGE